VQKIRFFFKQRQFTAEQKQNIEQKKTLRHKQRRRGLKRQNINFNEDRQGGGVGGRRWGIEYANEKCQNSNHSSGKIQAGQQGLGIGGEYRQTDKRINRFFFGPLPRHGLQNVKTFFQRKLNRYRVKKAIFCLAADDIVGQCPTLQMKGGRWESNINVWFPFMYSEKWNCAASLVPKQNCNVLSPNAYTHISVRDLYISRIGLSMLLQPNIWSDLGNILIPSQTHEYGNWDWGRAILRKGVHKWDFRCSVT
jgi:hypothetical protein